MKGKQNTNADDIDRIADLSLEEFDSITDKHIFSKGYKKKKKEVLKTLYGKKPRTTIFLKLAVVLIVMFISMPIVVNAATDGELFARLWGRGGHRNTDVHTELLRDEEKGQDTPVRFPEREYEETDTNKANELVGEIRQFESYSYTTGDGTIISVTSMISDGNAAVAEIIVENDNGIQGFEYNNLYNESKGAYFSMEATIDISFDCGQFFYVDIDNSTEKRIICYAYIPTVIASKGAYSDVRMLIREFPCKKKDYYGYDGVNNTFSDGDSAKWGSIKTESVWLKPASASSGKVFSGMRGAIDISPISMKVTFDEIHIDMTYSIKIQYKDGEEYDVYEKSTFEVTNDKYIDNTAYNCGFNEGFCELYIFNRLVDVDNVEKIFINNEEYSLEK